MESRYNALIAVLLLWGMFLLEFQFPLLLALALTLLTAVILIVERPTIDKIGLILLLNFFYWLVSGFLVQALMPLDLISFSFINGEGRIFVSYLPLLFFSIAIVREESIFILAQNIKYIAIISILLFAVWLVTKAAIISEGASGNFAGFLTSHTGSGTFFGIVCVFLILYGYISRNVLSQLLGWLMILPILGSASREALLALIVTGGWYVIITKKFKIALLGFCAFIVFAASAFILTPHMWGRTVSLFSWDLVENVLVTAKTTTNWEPTNVSREEKERNISGTQQNVLARIVFWNYALSRFAESPIFGIGFSRYNDADKKMKGVKGLFYPAVEGNKAFGVGNAHNSYFNILCESGVVGLLFFLWLWCLIYYRLHIAAKYFSDQVKLLAYFQAAQGLVVFSMTAALTGHALASPSLTLPVMTIIGAGLAFQRANTDITSIKRSI